MRRKKERLSTCWSGTERNGTERKGRMNMMTDDKRIKDYRDYLGSYDPKHISGMRVRIE